MVETEEEIEEKCIENGEGNKEIEKKTKITKYKKPKKNKTPRQVKAERARNVSLFKVFSLSVSVSLFCAKLIVFSEPMTTMDLFILLAIVLSPEFVSYLKVVLTGESESKDSKIALLEQENKHLKEMDKKETEKEEIKKALEHQREKGALKVQLAYYRGRDDGEKLEIACEGSTNFDLANKRIEELEKM